MQASLSCSLLQQKLENGRSIYESFYSDMSFPVSKRVDLTVSPTAKFASFPYHDYTPFAQFISRDELLKELKMEGMCCHEHGSSNTLINQSCDVSGSRDGVCIVTRSIILSNSHAGTHADQPKHFEKDPIIERFDESQYNGLCMVLFMEDVIPVGEFAIKKEHLEKLFEKISIPKSHIVRLLLKTRTQPNNDTEWTNDFCHFTVESAQYLAEEFENLLLIGIDTPSVDHPNKAPIIAFSHGQFWNKRIALLENLQFTNLPRNDKKSHLIGFLQTIFNPLQTCEDAIGCFVSLFPSSTH